MCWLWGNLNQLCLVWRPRAGLIWFWSVSVGWKICLSIFHQDSAEPKGTEIKPAQISTVKNLSQQHLSVCLSLSSPGCKL